MALLIQRVTQKQEPQSGVAGQFRRADEISSAIGLDLGKTQKQTRPAVGMTPGEMMQGPQEGRHCFPL